jgi:hypothetical protein
MRRSAHSSWPPAEQVYDPACVVVVGQVTRDPTREVEDALLHKCERGGFGRQHGLRLQLSVAKAEEKPRLTLWEWCRGRIHTYQARYCF